MSANFGLELSDEATVAAYLANRLDSARAAAFEDYCLKHPDFARRVEADLLLKEGMKQMQGQAQTRTRRAGHRQRIGLAIAAVLAAIVVCGLLLLPRLNFGALTAFRSEADVPAPLLAGTRVSTTLIRLRGDSTVRQVAVPAGAGVLRVRVAPDSAPGLLGYAIGVAIEPQVMARSVTLDHLQADGDGFVEMYLPLDAVAGKTLSVTVTPSPPAAAPPLAFRLHVVYAPNPN